MWNIVEISFLFLALSVWVTGEMITRWREFLPTAILQSYLYGSFAYRGEGSAVLRLFEMPKSYFKHFYVFATILSTVGVFLMWLIYNGGKVPDFIAHSFSSILLNDKPSVCFGATVSAMLLLTAQIYRRTYETQTLQVFAARSRINVSHYATGFIHYLGCIVTILGQAVLYSDYDKSQWLDDYTKTNLLPCSAVFLRAWYEQYKSNVILANLRRDKHSGAVVSEEHGLPSGRWFESVSSPHRLTEVIMYTALLVLIPTRTFLCIYLWVLLNQIQTAVLAHQWYQKTFKNYPKKRCAIFPMIL